MLADGKNSGQIKKTKGANGALRHFWIFIVPDTI
jgi:hypothetical protein